MGFSYLCVLALFYLAVMGVQASQSAEEYWLSVWPNKPVPKALWDLLQPSGDSELPIKTDEHMQYWTAFFKHDLHPGKKISLGFQRHSSVQPLGAWIWGRKTFKMEENSQTQPLGAWIWGKMTFQMEKNPQTEPFGVLSWKRKASQLNKSKFKEIKTGRDSLENICETPSTIGEQKYCATSLESMMDFAISKIGKNIKVISSSFAQNHKQYTVEEVRKVGEKAVMCHRLNFPKVVFYCHEVNATTSYIVPLVASDGTKSKALTICHHDTRGMDPHLLYEALKVKPGTVPVCHFMGNKAIAWVPNSSLNEVDHPCVS